MGWLNGIWNWLTRPEQPVRRSAEIVSDPDHPNARNAGWKDVFHLMALLEKHGAEYILVGGYALSFNGLTRQTGDVDILVSTTPENNRRWIAALSELPDGAASELLATADDPFTDPKKPYGASGPGVIRVGDEITVDVMPTTCGLTYEELKPHSQRAQTDWGTFNVLDLEGLRLTKQSVRAKDRMDLQSIEAAIRVLQGRVSERVAAMSKRDFPAEQPPTSERIEFKLEPQTGGPEDSTRLLAKAIIEKARKRGIILDESFGDRLAIYGDAAALTKMLEAADTIVDFDTYATELGIDDPKSQPG